MFDQKYFFNVPLHFFLNCTFSFAFNHVCTVMISSIPMEIDTQLYVFQVIIPFYDNNHVSTQL